jgi:hypothetical protein
LVPPLSAAEIWNRKYDGIAPRPEAVRFAADQGLGSFASLDYHSAKQFFPLAMTVELSAPATAPAPIEAIREGRCQPKLFAWAVDRFTAGPPASALRMMEHVRRSVARSARRVERIVLRARALRGS